MTENNFKNTIEYGFLLNINNALENNDIDGLIKYLKAYDLYTVTKINNYNLKLAESAKIKAKIN